MGSRERSARPLTTLGLGDRAQFALAVLSPAGWDGGALSRGEQAPLLTLAVLIYMWAFITCVGTDERRLEMNNVFFTLDSSGEILLRRNVPVVRHASLHIQTSSRMNIRLYLLLRWLVAVISPSGRGNISLEVSVWTNSPFGGRLPPGSWVFATFHFNMKEPKDLAQPLIMRRLQGRMSFRRSHLWTFDEDLSASSPSPVAAGRAWPCRLAV